jgi:hypothetical protein
MELITECNKLNLTQYKALFILVTAILALLVASPALQRVLIIPQTEFFTELSLLGPEHTAGNYPYNIVNGGNYRVFLGIVNQLGDCAYYQVQVKFCNETQSAPDSFNHTPSSQPSLYNLNVFVADKEILEIPVNFVFNYHFGLYSWAVVQWDSGKTDGIAFDNLTLASDTSTSTVTSKLGNFKVGDRVKDIYDPTVNGTITAVQNPFQVNFDRLTLNNETLNLQGYSSYFDFQAKKFYGNLILELWIYNGTTNTFQYHERFVSLVMNLG